MSSEVDVVDDHEVASTTMTCCRSVDDPSRQSSSITIGSIWLARKQKRRISRFVISPSLSVDSR
jgi:hypothetical protein